MRIDPKAKLAGHPILEIQELLKHHGEALYREKVEFELDLAPAERVLRELKRDGYIELRREHGDHFFAATMLGLALAMANAGSPITRARAESLVRQFLTRVREVNQDPRFLIRVVEVKVFGSYAAGALTLGDVDLAVRYERKDPDAYCRLAEAQVQNAKRAGHHFVSYFEEMSWPEDQVRKLLQGDSGFLSLHDLRVESSGPVAEAKVVLYSERPSRSKRNDRGRGRTRKGEPGLRRRSRPARARAPGQSSRASAPSAPHPGEPAGQG